MSPDSHQQPSDVSGPIHYELGDLVSVTNPLSQTTTRLFDGAGRVLRTTSPLGQTTLTAYNALNQVTQITDPLDGQTSFTYDGNGNLLTLTDARGKTTTWTYDDMDRVATRTDPLTRAESFAYDLDGLLTSTTDRKSQVTTVTHDALHRATFTGFGTTGTPPTYASSTTTTYDAGDRVTSVVDSVAGTITRTYDAHDRLTQEETPEGLIDYTYDLAGRRATMTVDGQTAVSYTYDTANRLTGVTQGTASVVIAYDAANRRMSLTLPNGIVTEYGYDTASQLTSLTYKLSGTTFGDLGYTYDANGQRTAVTGSYARSGLPAVLASATYDDANQIATFGGTSFSYDANGNLTSDGSKTYTWNARNELSGISGGVSASFSYNGFGRRRAKTVSGTTTQFLYDGLNPVQELASGTPTANLLTGLGIDEYFTRTDAAGARHYLTDALGSSVGLADGAGAVQTQYTYEPFGRLSTSGAATGNAFAYTAREADGTGLFFYRLRYYHPQLQRFISEDPIGVNGGINMHVYANNQPADLLDPTGLKPPPGFGGQPTGSGDPQGGAAASGSGTPPPNIPQIICAALPDGRTIGVGGGIGGLVGTTGSFEQVINYRTGESSLFSSGGLQAGWSGGANGNVFGGFISGDLGPGNKNYAGRFYGVNGSSYFGASVQSSGSVTSVTFSVGASVTNFPTFGTTASHYSPPKPAGNVFNAGSFGDQFIYLLKRAFCG